MTKHNEFHTTKRKYNDNGTEKSKHFYAKDTEHHCDSMGGKLTKYSFYLYGHICPLCGFEITELE